YFSNRLGRPDLSLRDLDTGAESLVAGEPMNAAKGFPAISPSGKQLAYATLVAGPRAIRSIYATTLADGISRQVCDDCGGRPRQWLDERYLLIETFGARFNRFAVVDTSDGSQRELLA